MDTLIEVLINAGPMGLFAGYLIYQNKNQEKRIDNWMEKQEQLEDKSQAREDQLRLRYDAVVAKIEREKGEYMMALSGKIEGLYSKISELHTQLQLIDQRLTRLEEDQK